MIYGILFVLVFIIAMQRFKENKIETRRKVASYTRYWRRFNDLREVK